ncbi:toll-like receptor 18 isoform X1 [Paramormyrops kingsleyae]|uniref:toll-like receptor 18 isoform X1 n=1 Tax=Paramormyrops kingsleyae TaxID=1676925 RepID=UPI003B973316
MDPVFVEIGTMVEQPFKVLCSAIGIYKIIVVTLLVSAYCSSLHIPLNNICAISKDNRTADCSGRYLSYVPIEALPLSLEELDLSLNALQEIHERDFCPLRYLRVLKLQFNNISLIEDRAFNCNTLLEDLNIFNNSLTSIPDKALEPLANLQNLYMSNNLYRSATLSDIFSTFTKLKILSLGGSLIPGLKEGDFRSIQHIYLDKFAIKTASSLKQYEQGCLKFIRTKNMWFDVAIDQKPNYLPIILQDLANMTFSELRFRNLFEFKYYTDREDIFHGLKDINMQQLILYRGKFNENVLRMALVSLQFSPVKSLSLLSLDFARSPTFEEAGMGSSVTDLVLDDLILRDISNPDILRFDWHFTWFSKVRRLTIKNVNFNFVPCDAWDEMNVIELLDLSKNQLQDTYLYNRQCDYVGKVPALQCFNISTNQLSSLVDVSALVGEFKKLQVIDLSYNQFGISKEVGVCHWRQNITKMILHHNDFGKSDLSCLPTTVQYLDLSDCNLDHVDMDYFQRVSDLKELLLSGNKIKFIPPGWSNPTLQLLQLDGNSFGLISMSSFKEMPRLSQLKAGNNPYHCTCDLHSFIQESTTKGKVNITDWPDNYRCYHPEAMLNTSVANFFPGLLECDIRLVIIISVVTTATVVLALMLLCYVFNVPWYTRAICHIIRAKYRAYQEGLGISKTFAYHAFISYSHSDADWVRDQLLTCLESNKPPYNICIHERDFMPGKWIIDNIIENIENSRKVIFVLSKHFVNSEWCNYELYFAQQRAIGKTFSDVVLVLKEPIDPDSLPNKYCKLKKMLNTKTYLEWPKDPKQQIFFWAQLKSVLGKPVLTRDRTISIRSRISSRSSNSTLELHVENPMARQPKVQNQEVALPEMNRDEGNLVYTEMSETDLSVQR